MHNLSILTAQIQNRVGLVPSRTTVVNPQVLENKPAIAAAFYDVVCFTQPRSSSETEQTSAKGLPNRPATTSATYVPTPFIKQPLTWVAGGAAIATVGGVGYWKRDLIQDTLNIGGDAGKLKRAKEQFEVVSKKYTQAKTSEAKKQAVAEMLSVLERNDSKLLNDLKPGALDPFKPELDLLKEEGKNFAKTALNKTSTALNNVPSNVSPTLAEEVSTLVEPAVDSLLNALDDVVAPPPPDVNSDEITAPARNVLSHISEFFQDRVNPAELQTQLKSTARRVKTVVTKEKNIDRMIQVGSGLLAAPLWGSLAVTSGVAGGVGAGLGVLGAGLGSVSAGLGAMGGGVATGLATGLMALGAGIGASSTAAAAGLGTALSSSVTQTIVTLAAAIVSTVGAFKPKAIRNAATTFNPINWIKNLLTAITSRIPRRPPTIL